MTEMAINSGHASLYLQTRQINYETFMLFTDQLSVLTGENAVALISMHR